MRQAAITSRYGLEPCTEPFSKRSETIKARSRTPRVSVVLPVLNEEKNIRWVLERLRSDLHKVLLVDGDSADNSVQGAVAVGDDIRIIGQRNRGKGAAVAAGLGMAAGDIAVVMDADGSLDPTKITKLVSALLAGVDVAKASRATVSRGLVDRAPIRRLGNRGLTFAASIMYRQNWREFCYSAVTVWADGLPLLGISEVSRTSVAVASSSSHRRASKRVAYGHRLRSKLYLSCSDIRMHLRGGGLQLWARGAVMAHRIS